MNDAQRGWGDEMKVDKGSREVAEMKGRRRKEAGTEVLAEARVDRWQEKVRKVGWQRAEIDRFMVMKRVMEERMEV